MEIVRAADSEAVGLRFIQRNNSDIDLEHKVAFNMPTIFSDILIEKNNIIDKLSKLRIYVIAHTLTSRKSQNLPNSTFCQIEVSKESKQSFTIFRHFY